MPKLPPDHKFWDLSDYARPGAILLVRILLPTRVGAITLTWLFTIVGLISVILIFNRYALALAGGLLILKSLLDAADGEMARARNCPSHTGRYLDSINDLLLNGLVLFAIGIPLTVPIWEILLTWFSFQLQGTIFNYFYVVKRHQASGDITSRISEFSPPVPYPQENPAVLSVLHKIYIIFYGWQDWIINKLFKDNEIVCSKSSPIPNWIMSMISVFGLGFQLLILAVLLCSDRLELTFPIFLIVYNLLATAVLGSVYILGRMK